VADIRRAGRSAVGAGAAAVSKVPFNKPYMTGREFAYIEAAHRDHALAGNGAFTRACQRWLEDRTGAACAMLVHSCTAALEMSAILAESAPGDEVIMPSFTFVSTANAFCLRGATPVFVDVRADTFNIDETRIEAAVTPRTKAIVPVHYAGVGCEMDAIMQIARRHNLLVIEDAAQGISAAYKGRPLGSIGHLSALSFHETKNVIAGEGGALLINDARFADRAETIREKGTNRSRFFRGQTDKYTWIDIGSSFLPGEIVAAFLLAQMEQADAILRRRRALWQAYHAAFERLEQDGRLRRPIVPAGCEHNAHIYYLVLPDAGMRTRLIEFLAGRGVNAVFHYVPLHLSPKGKAVARVVGDMRNTERAGNTLVRLPLFMELTEGQQAQVIAAVEDCLRA
jgi:dTDP-4-amino-4,6-dideoxygalactose transaminase